VKALRKKLDPGNQTLAALRFCHTSQQPSESVSRFEKVFQMGFGCEHLSIETREMLLYGQLPEDLLYALMESPSVSGAQSYKELCLAATREERREDLLSLRKSNSTEGFNHHHQVILPIWQQANCDNPDLAKELQKVRKLLQKQFNKEGIRQQKQLRCYICNSPNHLALQCKQSKTENAGRKDAQSKSGNGMKII